MILTRQEYEYIMDHRKTREIVLDKRKTRNIGLDDKVYISAPGSTGTINILDNQAHLNLRTAVTVLAIQEKLHTCCAGYTTAEVINYYTAKFERNMYKYTYTGQPVRILLFEPHQSIAVPRNRLVTPEPPEEKEKIPPKDISPSMVLQRIIQ